MHRDGVDSQVRQAVASSSTSTAKRELEEALQREGKKPKNIAEKIFEETPENVFKNS